MAKSAEYFPRSLPILLPAPLTVELPHLDNVTISKSFTYVNRACLFDDVQRTFFPQQDGRDLESCRRAL